MVVRKRYRLKVGDRRGRLVVLGRAPSTDGSRAVYEFQCDCGAKHVARGSHVNAGLISSCGCLQLALAADRKRTHGGTGTVEYRAWQLMISRCENPSSTSYSRYGAAGIKVCKRWRESFDAFLTDMGERPSSQHSLDRFPNQRGDYEPGNCRWATATQQCRNRRNTVFVVVRGERLALGEACERFGVKYASAHALLSAGRNPDIIFKQREAAVVGNYARN